MQGAVTSKKHFNNLDATRFFSFLHIFTNHIIFSNSALILQSGLYVFVKSYVARGFFGIDYFFVLSSFLITWIIIEEQARTGKFNILYFGIRRSLRLWPLYFVVVIFGFILVEVARRYWGVSSEPLPPFYNFLFFTLNFYIIRHGDHFLFFMVFFWSISIEEQFYLVWAIFHKFFKNYFHVICVLLILVSLIFRYLNYGKDHTMVYHTFSLLGNFSVGALLAQVCFAEPEYLKRWKEISKRNIALIYLFIALNIIFYNQVYNLKFFVVFERLIFAVFFAFIIFEQEFCTHSFIKLGRWKFINYLGSLSFGLYCFHGIAITILIQLSGKFPQICDSIMEVFLINPILIMAFTILMSIISFENFEKKMLQLKNRFYSPTV